MNDAAHTTPAARPRRRRPPWLRLLKWLLLGLLVLLLVLAVFIGWVAGTRSGLEFAWSLVEPRLPDSIEVAAVEGRLIGPLTVSGVTVDNKSMHLEVERVHLEWQAADLLSATVHIEKLAVRGVRYQGKAAAPEQPPPGENTEPFALPDEITLPLQVRIDRLAIDDVAVTPSPAADTIVLKRARLKDARLTNDIWRIGSLTAHGPMFDLELHAEIVPHGRYAVDVALNAALRLPNLAPIRTELRIDGDLDKLTVTQHVAAPYNVSLDATITDIALNRLAGIGIRASLELHSTRLSAIRADLPDAAPITSQLQISGTPRKLTFKQTVAAPYNAQLAGTLANILDTPVIDARLTLNGTQLAAIMKDLPKVVLAVKLNVSGRPKQLEVALDAEADSAKHGRVTATARVRYTPEAVTIERLRLQRPGTPMRLTASGTVALSKGNRMDLTLQWQQLRWPLGGQPAYRSRGGRFRLTGTLKDYHITGEMSWQVTGQAEGRLQLTGSGSMKSFHLARLQISGAPGDITATADVTWAPSLDVQAHIEGHHINPGAVVPGIPGDFSLVADIRARQKGGTIVAHVDTLKADGTLRGQPLHLEAELAYLGDHVKIPRFELDYAAAAASIGGRFGWTPDSSIDLRWHIQARDLATLWPELAGALQTQGTLQGTLSSPSIDAELTARNIEYGDYRIASVDLNAEVDWSGNTQSRVTLEVAGAHVAGQAIQSLALELTGTPSDHSLEVNLDSSKAQLELALTGGLNKQRMVWDFTLTSLRVAYGKLAPWTLAAPASGRVAASAQRIASACLTSGGARLCISGEHTAEGTRVSVRLDDLAFAYAEPFMPENLRVAGALSGTVKARIPAGGTPVVQAHLKTTPGRITTVNANGERVQVLAFDPARVDLSLDGTGLDAALALPLADTGAIHAEIGVAAGNAPLTQRPLSGRVEINIARLDFLTRLVAEVAAVDGHIDGSLRISGTLASPRILGSLALEASRLVLLTPGLELTDVRLAAAGHGEVIDISMVAHSGGGKLTVDGKIRFGGGPTIELAIDGRQFQVANTPMVRAWISPDLDVSVTPQAVRVSGRLEVPRARITPRDLPPPGVETVAADAVIVTGDKHSAAEAAARAIYADITVVLGDVRFEGFGLKTGITGTLHVTQTPGQPVIGAGKLTLVDGSYRAYGQNLEILHGTIYFAGPISAPAIELRAARYPAEDIIVGVEVHGSVKSPTVTLFSDPPMSQAETLSWLLLGRPLEGTTGGQDNLIAKAALALGSGRANKMLNNIGKALGVDDIGLGSAAGHGASEAAFMVGKYLTPKLYISYGIGIFSGIGTLTLRYTLNSHWKLETSTSDVATGVDLIYTFER